MSFAKTLSELRNGNTINYSSASSSSCIVKNVLFGHFSKVRFKKSLSVNCLEINNLWKVRRLKDEVLSKDNSTERDNQEEKFFVNTIQIYCSLNKAVYGQKRNDFKVEIKIGGQLFNCSLDTGGEYNVTS